MPALAGPWPAGTARPCPRRRPRRRRLPKLSMWVGWPRGPATSRRAPPTGVATISCVELPDRLDDQGDGAGRGVVVGDRQGDALGALADAHDDELAGLAGARHARREDVHAMELGGDLLVADDFEHADLVLGVWAFHRPQRAPASCMSVPSLSRDCNRRHACRGLLDGAPGWPFWRPARGGRARSGAAPRTRRRRAAASAPERRDQGGQAGGAEQGERAGLPDDRRRPTDASRRSAGSRRRRPHTRRSWPAARPERRPSGRSSRACWDSTTGGAAGAARRQGGRAAACAAGEGHEQQAGEARRHQVDEVVEPRRRLAEVLVAAVVADHGVHAC